MKRDMWVKQTKKVSSALLAAAATDDGGVVVANVLLELVFGISSKKKILL